MKAVTRLALTGAVILGFGFVPAGAHAQSRDAWIRTFDLDHPSRIGVSVQDVENAESDAKSLKAGVVVETVDNGGPADKAGIRKGDAITEFDGERVRGARQFSRLIEETPAGRSVPVVVSRAGQRLTITVTPERSTFDNGYGLRLLDVPMARPAAPPAPPAPARPPRAPSLAVPAMPRDFPLLRAFGGRRLGISIEEIDDQLAEYFGVKEGVLVRSVEDGSAAQKAGLKAGDVITSVNGRQVYDASDVNRALDRTENDDFTLEVMRDRKAQTLKGKLEPRETRTRG